MARLGPPPAPAKPRNPCWLYRLRDIDPELFGDVVAALDDPAWSADALAEAVTERVPGLRVGRNGVGVHVRRQCETCRTFGVMPVEAS